MAAAVFNRRLDIHVSLSGEQSTLVYPVAADVSSWTCSCSLDAIAQDKINCKSVVRSVSIECSVEGFEVKKEKFFVSRYAKP